MGKRKHFKWTKQLCDKKGFSTTALIIAIISFVFTINITLTSINLISRYHFNDEKLQDQIGIIQLTRYLNSADNINISEDKIDFVLNDEVMRVNLVNNNLIIQPGTQFILINIKKVNFYKIHNLIYIKYERDNQNYEMVIGCA